MPSKQTKSAKDFLNKVFIDDTIWANMADSFRWLTMFPRLGTDARSVTYNVQQYNAYTDPKKQKPMKRVPSTKFPFITFSQLEPDFAKMEGEGLAVKIDQEILDHPDMLDEFDRAINYLGTWMAEAINADILSILTAKVTHPEPGLVRFQRQVPVRPEPVQARLQDSRQAVQDDRRLRLR